MYILSFTCAAEKFKKSSSSSARFTDCSFSVSICAKLRNRSLTLLVILLGVVLGQRTIICSVTKVQGESGTDLLYFVSLHSLQTNLLLTQKTKHCNVVYLLPYGLVSLHRGADAQVLIVHMGQGKAVSSEVVATLMDSPLAA